MSGLARVVLEERRRKRKRENRRERDRLRAVEVWCLLSDCTRPARGTPRTVRDHRIAALCADALSALARRPPRHAR